MVTAVTEGQVRVCIGDGCKTVGSAYVGSNPTPATIRNARSGTLCVVWQGRNWERCATSSAGVVRSGLCWSARCVGGRLTGTAVCPVNTRRSCDAAILAGRAPSRVRAWSAQAARFVFSASASGVSLPAHIRLGRLRFPAQQSHPVGLPTGADSLQPGQAGAFCPTRGNAGRSGTGGGGLDRRDDVRSAQAPDRQARVDLRAH